MFYLTKKSIENWTIKFSLKWNSFIETYLTQIKRIKLPEGETTEATMAGRSSNEMFFNFPFEIFSKIFENKLPTLISYWLQKINKKTQYI